MKKLVAIFMLLIIIIYCSSCNEAAVTDDEQLTFYTCDNYSGFLYNSVIDYYNRYCINTGNKRYMIKEIKFDSMHEMETKMSTEIMSGGGPDLFSIEQSLPFEKLGKSGVFADIDELLKNDTSKDKLNLDDYNSVVMESGVFDGKRYIVPISYGADIMVGYKSELEKHHCPTEQGYSLLYENIQKDFGSFFKNHGDTLFLSTDGFTETPDTLFFKIINNYIDKEDKTTDFNTTEFKNALNSFDRIKNCSGSVMDEESMDFSTFKSTLFTTSISAFNTITEDADDYVMFKGFSRSKEDYNAYVKIGLAFNRNCRKTESMLRFLKFALGKDRQERLCGAKGNVAFDGETLPVLNSAFDKCINRLDKDNEFIKSYVDICKNINYCTLTNNSFAYTNYYNRMVIGKLVNDYTDGKIPKNKFIRNLTSATQIYLFE